MCRNTIKEILLELEELSRKYNYQNVEVALALFLRADVYTLEHYITDNELEEIKDYIEQYDSLMCDELRKDIDFIIDK